ncbi:ATP-binding protein [Microbacterium sp. GXS0129]|uniref:ATP-binding protein n=1 Tax=Microbacterium sp. GXS0129 TaxID=3377836 RepID=UPI00383A756C
MTARLEVLGPVRLEGADITGHPMRCLLVSLALAGPGVTRSVSSLAEDVWGEVQPLNPRAALQTLISRLRALGGADIVTRAPGGYALGAMSCDLDDVRRILAQPPADPAGAAAALRAAAALWREGLAADLGDSSLADTFTAVAADLRDDVLRALAAAQATAGQSGAAADTLRELVERRPFDEPAHIALMQALADDGRTAESLDVFARFRAELREALGTTAGAAITELNARLLRTEDRGPRVRVGLRAAPNELIGRGNELVRARALLRTSRLVTVLGAGGLGKTRFAQALAAESDAPVVIVVPLAGVRADEGVPLAIAAALGISETAAHRRLAEPLPRPDLAQRIIGALGDRTTLLVLDNCEQVVDGAARWAAELLAAAPALRILATSRSPLAIAAESVLALEPLQVDAVEDAPAVRLFVQRARSARPGAALALDAVARLCARLDGLPLAIELAAARVRTMSLAQIEERLEDRFALLTTGDRSAPERHRTLQAVIEWSWELLPVDAREALAHLSVLPGGFSAEAAAAILGLAFADDLLDALASQSLLTIVEDADSGMFRFRMLETVREFGHDRLEEASRVDEAWEAVIAWALAFVAQHGAPAQIFPSGLTADGHRAVTEEHDNLVHVLRHLIDASRDDEAVALFAVLAQSWFIRGSFTEFLGYAPAMAAAAERADAAQDLSVIALAMAALGCMIAGDSGAVRALAVVRARERSIGDGLSPAWRLVVRALLASGRGAGPGLPELVGPGEPPAVLLVADLLRSHAAENDGQPEEAMIAARSGWERARALGERWAEGMAADLAAQLAAQSADATEAMVWLGRAAEVFREYDAQDQLNHQEWVRGGALLCLGQADDARQLFQHLIDEGGLSQDGLELTSIGAYGLAEADLLDGDLVSAAASFDRALASFALPETRRSPWFLMALSGYLSAALRSLDLPREDVAIWERRLRTRTIAVCRQRREGVDRPVLGTALLGWSAWALRDASLRARGVEAIALAEVLGGRQNMPTLNLAAHLADARAYAGAEVVEAARERSRLLSPQERVEHGLAVLGYAR